MRVFPNYDWRHSCIVPALSRRVTVVGTVHENDGLYIEHAARLGRYFDAVVATSRPAARHIRGQLPHLEDRLSLIPYGIGVPENPVPRTPASTGATVLMVRAGYDDGPQQAGRLEALARALVQCKEVLRLVAVDPAESLREAMRGAGAIIASDLNRQQWLDLCRSSHFVVTDSLRGASWRMTIEAMGHGCVPVFIAAGPGDECLIRDRDNGVIAPGEAPAIVTGRICSLVSDQGAQNRMATRAYDTARNAGYRAGEVVDAFLALFRRLAAGPHPSEIRRRRNPILPPPASVDGIDVFTLKMTRRTKLGSFPTRADATRFQEEAGAFVRKSVI